MALSLFAITILVNLPTMTIQSEFTRMIELFQLPFMHRALIGSVLTGFMGGLMGSFTVLRQLSFLVTLWDTRLCWVSVSDFC